MLFDVLTFLYDYQQENFVAENHTVAQVAI